METLEKEQRLTTIEELTREIFKKEATPARRFGSAPPKRGLCRRCGENKPINRLMLCYECWVKVVLEEKIGWREGMPHPDWCECSLPEHARRSDPN